MKNPNFFFCRRKKSMVDMVDTIPKKLYDALRKDSDALPSQKLTQELKQRKTDTWMGHLLFPLVGKKFFHSQKINPTLENVYKQYFNKSELTRQDKADIMKIQKMYGALRLFHGSAEPDVKRYKIGQDDTYYRRQVYYDEFYVLYTWNNDNSLRITISDGQNALSFIFVVDNANNTARYDADKKIINLPPLNQLITIEFFDSITSHDNSLKLQPVRQQYKLSSFHSCINSLYKAFEDPNNFKNNSANPTWRIRSPAS